MAAEADGIVPARRVSRSLFGNSWLGDSGSLLATYLRPQWPRVVLLAALLLGNIAFQLASPQIQLYFIDAARAGRPRSTLLAVALVFLAVGLAGQVAAVVEAYVAIDVAQVATNALRAVVQLENKARVWVASRETAPPFCLPWDRRWRWCWLPRSGRSASRSIGCLYCCRAPFGIHWWRTTPWIRRERRLSPLVRCGISPALFQILSRCEVVNRA